jgi:uncharacterized membrane protein YhaH (DUF805 family)
LPVGVFSFLIALFCHRNKSLWGYFIACFKKYAVFQGRARRKEYWGFYFFYAVFSAIAVFLDIIFDLQFGDSYFGVISGIWIAAAIMPYWSVSVRRYHDCDKRGWVMLMPVYSFVLTLLKGTHGENRFGEDPNQRPDVANVNNGNGGA